MVRPDTGPAPHGRSGAAPTPGKAAHDTWCADGDWDELDGEARELWEDAAQAAIVAAAASSPLERSGGRARRWGGGD